MNRESSEATVRARHNGGSWPGTTGKTEIAVAVGYEI
jgi:hypothetical protein